MDAHQIVFSDNLNTNDVKKTRSALMYMISLFANVLSCEVNVAIHRVTTTKWPTNL